MPRPEYTESDLLSPAEEYFEKDEADEEDDADEDGDEEGDEDAGTLFGRARCSRCGRARSKKRKPSGSGLQRRSPKTPRQHAQRRVRTPLCPTTSK